MKLKRNFWGNPPYIKCLNCGYEGKSKYIRPGSSFAEFLLRCTLIFGIFYSIYRNKKSGCICPKCRTDNIIKISKDEVGKVSQLKSLDQLSKLAELKDKGILTQEEFEVKKKELI